MDFKNKNASYLEKLFWVDSSTLTRLHANAGVFGKACAGRLALRAPSTNILSSQ